MVAAMVATVSIATVLPHWGGTALLVVVLNLVDRRSGATSSHPSFDPDL